MDSRRYEPGPTDEYGASGLPREGMTERYSTAMWRDDPGAFWLHPEGPLSDTTPDEYFVPRPEPVASPYAPFAGSGLTGSGAMSAYQNAYGSLAQQQLMNNYRAQNARRADPYGLGSLLGGLL